MKPLDHRSRAEAVDRAGSRGLLNGPARARFFRRSVALWVVCFGFLLPALGAAEDTDRRAQDIIRTTMSPFCPGRTLEGCSSSSAAVWRDDVRHWVIEGLSTQEIRKRLKARVPQADLTGAPSTVLDNILPALVTVVAVVLLVFLLRGLIRPRKRAALKAQGKKRTEKQEQHLEEELDEALADLDD